MAADKERKSGMNDQLECGNCGRHNIVEAIDYIAGVKQTGAMKCAICGSRDIKTVTGSQLPVSGFGPATDNRKLITDNGAVVRQEEVMAKTYPHAKCMMCQTKQVVINGECSACFKLIHGLTVSEYKRRLQAGEKKEEILAKEPVRRETKRAKRDTKPVKAETSVIKEFEVGDLVAVKKKKGSSDIPPDVSIMVPFADHLDLLSQLEEMAAADLRSSDQEILALIRDAYMERESGYHTTFKPAVPPKVA